ncbi:ankyrin-3-like [Corticium candelabrum]|uniref:ankyrin-3-like n=1 Tax=Corticium candelabrum TaxID=121492 RepID=UPI002E2733A3|nr:ankyrin-3-like [Corticium candelabrum]
MTRNVARAAEREEWERVQLLVEEGESVNATVWGSFTALHFAVGHENADICSFLLSRGANVTMASIDGHTPLHIAACCHHADICQLLVDHKADVTCVNKEGDTPLLIALASMHYLHDIPAVCRPLITNESVNVADLHGNCAVHIAAKIDAVDRDGNQPLHLACKRGHTSASLFLLSHGADVNALNEYGQTPLHTAAGGEEDNPELCSNLLKRDAKIDAAVCSKRDCFEVCEMLIAKGSPVNVTDSNGHTSLQLACQKGHMTTADVLVKSDADCNVLNVFGETLLHLACKSRVECVELCDKLISHGVNPHVADREGNLPLHVALKNRLSKTFCYLFQKSGDAVLDDLQKANIDKEDLMAIFSSAHEADNINNCRHILEFSAKLDPSSRLCLREANCHTTTGYSLIQRAVEQQNIAICLHLIACGASVNSDIPYSPQEHGATSDPKITGTKGPLHVAVFSKQKDIVRLLLSHGADISKVPIGKEAVLRRLEIQKKGKMASIIQASETFPEEIVSPGEAALRVYLSYCSEGSAVNVFLRVDVVGRDGVGKTSLTKSLTLQKFNPDEPSTIGVVFDPKCQIIVKEACDWTKPLTSADYAEIYEKNVVINMAEALDTPEVKDQYFKSKESEYPRKQNYTHMAKKSSNQDLRVQAVPVGSSHSMPSMPRVPPNDCSPKLTVPSQKPTTLVVPAQSVPSGLSSSLQTSSNLSAFKDSNVSSHIAATDAKPSGGTEFAVESCSSSDHTEADFRNVDNLVGDEGDRKSMASNFSSDLQSSQETNSNHNKRNMRIKMKRQADVLYSVTRAALTMTLGCQTRKQNQS